MIDVQYLSVEDLKEITSISNNIDPSFLQPYIKSSENMFVVPVLGTALDTELKSAITGNTLSDLQNNLINFYIKPYSAYSSFLMAVPFLAFKATNKGIVRQNSDNSEIPTVEDINYYKQSIKDIQTFYKTALQDYLNENATLFPNYRADCEAPLTNNSNGIYLGLYS
jgi:hypothetical protein